MATMAARSTTPQSPSSLTPSIGSITPPPITHGHVVPQNQMFGYGDRNYRLRAPGRAHPEQGGSGRNSPPQDIEESSSDDSDGEAEIDPNLHLTPLPLTPDLTVAQSGDPYARNRPSATAEEFVPAAPSSRGHLGVPGNPYSSKSPMGLHGASPMHPAHHGTPTHLHGTPGGYRTRHSISPASVNHHDARHPYGYNVNVNQAPSPSNGGRLHHLGPPPQHQQHQHHYSYADSEGLEAHMNYLAGDPIPSPRHFDYSNSAGPMHLRTPRHMRGPSATPHGDFPEKRTFLALRLLEKVQYCAYKLDHLQEKYKEEYVRQQELHNNVQSMRTMSPRNPRITQMVAYAASSREAIRHILMEVARYYQQMKVYLSQRIPLQLSHDEEGIFAKFQSYFERFDATQMHLVQAGLQHLSQQPITPGTMGPSAVPVVALAGGVTGVGGPGAHPHGHRSGGLSFISNGTDSRNGSTRKGESMDPNELQPTNAYPLQIPEFGYVVIGTRMSQMISLIVPALTETEQQQNHIREHIEHLVKECGAFSSARIVAYGSATNDLFIKGSDLNFCVKQKKLGMSVADASKQICEVLRNGNFAQVQQITRLNGEPGISFLHPQTDLKCVLSFNMMKEIGSSRLIRAYATIDSRFKHIAQVVKHWSIRRNICGPEIGGSESPDQPQKGLTPYALVLMVINFLQQRRPPVLPILSIMVEPETGSSPWADKDDFQINTQKFREFAAKNEESAAGLLVAFFRFYAHEFDTHNLVVSVRTGSFLTKAEKKWDNEDHPHLLSIEDPFDSNKDLGEGIQQKTVHFIVSEFMRANRVLCQTFKIYDVCKPYHSEKEASKTDPLGDVPLGGSPLMGGSGALGPNLSPGPMGLSHRGGY